MSRRSTILIVIFLVIIVAEGIYLLNSTKNDATPKANPENENIQNPDSGEVRFPTEFIQRDEEVVHLHEDGSEHIHSQSDAVRYNLTDVAKHNTQNDCWIAVDDQVYDVTGFIPEHPGGQAIIKYCGTNATSVFYSQPEHYEQGAPEHLTDYKIGSLGKVDGQGPAF